MHHHRIGGRIGGGLVWFLALATSMAQGATRVAHVFHFSVDGLSATCFRDMLATNGAAYPNFVRLINEGASTLNARCDYDFSETMPNHASMLMGRPVLQPAGQPDTMHHGYTNITMLPGQTYHNAGNSNVDYFVSAFDVVHDHGLSTALFAGKNKLAICYQSYDDVNGAPDVIGEDNGRNKVDYAYILDWFKADGVALMGTVTNYLATNAPNYLFLHLADLDYIGHYTGWGSARYVNELGRMDGCLGGLLAAMDRNPELAGQTAIILTTDHGGGSPPYSHVYPEHPLNYTIPFMVWGPGWPAGANVYDLLANRFDPGANRIDYAAAEQPIRNGDAPNLAMALLGLPPIPGSFILPVLKPVIVLAMRQGSEGLILSWPSDSDGYELEVTDRFTASDSWQTITTGIDDDGTTKTYTVPPEHQQSHQYFRLRKGAR